MVNLPTHRSERVRFTNAQGVSLAGILEWPQQPPRAYAVFSHCFTCTKDLKAIVKISRQIARHGIAVLRFDFTGLGDSQGDFSQTTFDNNLEDVSAAIQFLREHYQAPQLLIGHSLGGAAMICSVSRIPEVRAIVNIASPSTTQHLAKFLSQSDPAIEANGSGQVTIGGRTYTMQRQMVEVLRSVDLPSQLTTLTLPLLVIFSPRDETLPFHHGIEMFRLAGGPTSFLHLDGADHLLVNQPNDVIFVGDMIATWFGRYVVEQ